MVGSTFGLQTCVKLAVEAGREDAVNDSMFIKHSCQATSCTNTLWFLKSISKVQSLDFCPHSCFMNALYKMSFVKYKIFLVFVLKT